MDKQTLVGILEQPGMWPLLDKKPLERLREQYPYFHTVDAILFAADAENNQAPLWCTDTFDAARLKGLPHRPKAIIVDVPVEPLPAPEPEMVILPEPVLSAPEDDILQLINQIPLHAEIAIDSIAHVSHGPEVEAEPNQPEPDVREKSLMVMMSFTDWLNYYKVKQLKEQEEAESKKALNASWQKEKLAAAIEEDIDEEVPEPIFKQAMDSISTESGVISESLAKLLASQGKTDRAIAMYKKLSLRNPEKSSYFARLIEQLTTKTH